MEFTKALVLGANTKKDTQHSAFGGIHARVAAKLGAIDEILVARTTLDAARETARVLFTGGPLYRGVKVANPDDLVTVLQTYEPGLVINATKDPTKRHDVHDEYTNLALESGAAVFEEKPHINIDGSGRSVRSLMDMPRGWYAMNLPMLVLAKHDGGVIDAIKQSGTVDVYWQSKITDNPLEDLGPHAVSFVPEEAQWIPQEITTEETNGVVKSTVPLYFPSLDRTAQWTFNLGRGDTRALDLDKKKAVGVHMNGVKNTLVAVTLPYDIGTVFSENRLPTPIQKYATVDNPILAGMNAVRQGAPYVGRQDAIRTHQLLEDMAAKNA